MPSDRDKKPCLIFASYCHGDTELKRSLLEELRPNLGVSLKRRYEIWDDSKLILGRPWKDEILKALDDSTAGLLLISPRFLASDFITEIEIKQLMAGSKILLPVMVSRVDFALQDTKGLDAHQCFGVDKPFEECSGSAQKRNFAHKLYVEIEKRMDAS